MLLTLKLFLVPLLIAGVTLAARRWGSRVAGLATALPVVAGPTLCFYAIDQGNTFAAEATRATLLGLVAVGAFCFTYAHASVRFNWLISLLAGWLAFGVVTVFLYRVRLGLLADLIAAVFALVTVRALLPVSRPVALRMRAPSWDLPLRMLAAAALVLVLTSAAERLGPDLTGVLTPFPVATAILAGFTHAQDGPAAVTLFFRGFLPSLCTFAVFCFVLAAGLTVLGLPLALVSALSAQLALQGGLLWFSLRPVEGQISVASPN